MTELGDLKTNYDFYQKDIESPWTIDWTHAKEDLYAREQASTLDRAVRADIKHNAPFGMLFPAADSDMATMLGLARLVSPGQAKQDRDILVTESIDSEKSAAAEAPAVFASYASGMLMGPLLQDVPIPPILRTALRFGVGTLVGGSIFNYNSNKPLGDINGFGEIGLIRAISLIVPRKFDRLFETGMMIGGPAFLLYGSSYESYQRKVYTDAYEQAGTFPYNMLASQIQNLSTNDNKRTTNR